MWHVIELSPPNNTDIMTYIKLTNGLFPLFLSLCLHYLPIYMLLVNPCTDFFFVILFTKKIPGTDSSRTKHYSWDPINNWLNCHTSLTHPWHGYSLHMWLAVWAFCHTSIFLWQSILIKTALWANDDSHRCSEVLLGFLPKK